MPDSILSDLVRLQELLRGTLERARRDAGSRASEHAVLRALDAGGALSGAALSRAARVTPQSMHGVLVRLRREGLIVAGAHPTDKRLRVFSLTKDGRREAATATARLAEVEARLTGGLTDDERAGLAASVSACVAALEGLDRRLKGDAEEPEGAAETPEGTATPAG